MTGVRAPAIPNPKTDTFTEASIMSFFQFTEVAGICRAIPRAALARVRLHFQPSKTTHIIQMAYKGLVASLLGTLVVACSGCGGGGGGGSQAPTQQAAAAPAPGEQIAAITPKAYADGSKGPSYRLPVSDQGPIIKYGSAPNNGDQYGARDAFIYQADGKYYITYDGAAPTGWNTVLASSTDLMNWSIQGNIMKLGAPGSDDSFCVCWGTTTFDGTYYRMYYTTSNNGYTTPPYPLPQYDTKSAYATSPTGPWTKNNGLTIEPSQYGYDGVSPGSVIQYNGQWLQFFSTGTHIDSKGGCCDGSWQRTVVIGRATSAAGPWTLDSTPALPNSEQLENATVWYQQETGTWFLFVDHVGYGAGNDANWVYWTQDPNHWDVNHKAVVMDSTSAPWSSSFGIPSIIRVGNKLAVVYDGRPPTNDTLHGLQDVALAWVQLPIKTP